MAQLGERCGQLRRDVLGGEVQSGRAGEHRVVDGRVVAGEVEVGVRDAGQGGVSRIGVGARRPHRFGELAEAVDGDGVSDLFHAGEVLVQHGLAVLDLGGQPARGHGVPAFGLGQGAGGGDDQLPAGGPLTLSAIVSGHT